MQAFRKTWMWPFALLSIPPVLWGMYALANGYTLEGDNAHIAIRTFDVFSSNPPLLGMPSTAGSEVAGVNAFHPGPLQFLLLAPVYALSGFSTWGIVVSSLIMNLGIVAIGLWAAWKIELPWVKFAVVTTFAVLCVALATVLSTPWNPYPVCLAVVTLVVLVWGIVVGVRGLVPWAVVVASLVVQAHLIGVVFVPALAAAMAFVIFRFRAAARLSKLESIAALAVLLGCWIFPLWEMIANWPGNPGQILRYVIGDKGTGAAQQASDGGSIDLGAIVFMLLLAAVSFVGFKRARRYMGKKSAFECPNDVQTMAIGLVLASSITAVSSLSYVVFSNRGLYISMFFGVWILQLLLIKPRDIPWWVERSRTTWIVLLSAVVVAIPVTNYGSARIAEGHQNRVLVAEAQSILTDSESTSVVIHQLGTHVLMSSGMTVIHDQIVRGRDVYFEQFGGREDYDLQRRIARAPEGHLTLHIVQQNDDGSWPELEPGRVLDTREVYLVKTQVNIRLVLTK